MKMFLQVTDDFGLVPVENDGIKYLYNRKPGTILKCEVVQERNYQFHKKAMALVKLVHDNLPAPAEIEYKGKRIQPVRTFDDTRKYLTILAGEYEVIGLPNGKARAEARSWKFNKMSQEQFDTFYSNLIDAAIKALPDEWTDEELNSMAEQVINFV